MTKKKESEEDMQEAIPAQDKENIEEKPKVSEGESQMEAKPDSTKVPAWDGKPSPRTSRPKSAKAL